MIPRFFFLLPVLSFAIPCPLVFAQAVAEPPATPGISDLLPSTPAPPLLPDAPASPSPSPEGVRAAEAFTRKDWDTARAAYQSMLKTDPDNAMILANLGAVEQQAGKPEAALLYLEKAVALNPRLVSSWTLLGLLYHDEGRTYHAISALSRAIHEDPRDPKPHHYLGLIIRGIGWTDAAEAELQRALELDPQYAEAHFNLALMYLDRTPPTVEMARHHYRQSLKNGTKPDAQLEARLKEVSEPAPAPATPAPPPQP
jgi:Tfp pilus assembly protein PilF